MDVILLRPHLFLPHIIAWENRIKCNKKIIFFNIENSKKYLEKGLDLIRERIIEAQMASLYMILLNYPSDVLFILGNLEKGRTLLGIVIMFLF